MLSEQNTIVIISVVVAAVLVLVIVGVVIFLIRRKYKLNWYQRSTLEDSQGQLIKSKKHGSGTLHVVKQQIYSRMDSSTQSESSSSDEESGGDRSALLKEVNTPAPPTGLFDKLSKRVGFIQPIVSDPRRSSMGAEESKQSIKPILKHKTESVLKGGNSRRFSAPVVYGKGSTDLVNVYKQAQAEAEAAEAAASAAAVFRRALSTPPVRMPLMAIQESHGHTKLSATRSAPYGSPIAELEEGKFTLPLTVSDEMSSANAKARLARRRTSMQDSIDASAFDPSLYKKLERTPTIKEESSVDINEPVGVLYLTVSLTNDASLLKVVLHKADFTGFPTSPLQLKTPYFSAFVIGSKSPTRQTRHLADTNHPLIEETFLFEVEDDLSGKKLVCHLYDYEQFVKSEEQGVVQVRLSTIPLNEPISIQKHIDRVPAIDHDHDDSYVGELRFSLKCCKAKDGLLITLFISQAKDLHIEDELAVLGLMVKATVLEQGKRYKKKRTVDSVKVATSPMFNQEIVIYVAATVSLQDLSVIVDVCKVRLSSSEVIGRVHIGPLSGLKEEEHWREFQNSTTSEGKVLEWWHQLRKVDKGS